MITFLSVLGAAYLVGSLFYIHRLKMQLQGYEHVWQQIEDIADRNEDGSFTINIQHLEEAHHESFEAHAANAPSSARLINLNTLDGSHNPNKAA